MLCTFSIETYKWGLEKFTRIIFHDQNYTFNIIPLPKICFVL